jgi:hypothetical protein
VVSVCFLLLSTGPWLPEEGREKSAVRIANLFPAVVFLFAANSVFAQQQTHAASRDSLVSDTAAFGEGQQPGTQAATKSTQKQSGVKIFGSWRFRTEAWDWFLPAAGENAYGFVHSFLRVGIRQTNGRFEWLAEGAQDAILGLTRPSPSATRGN